MKLPAFQFYPGDWLKDLNLRRCSFAAQGVWINLLCLMFQSEERGVLITGSRAWSEMDCASAIGGNRDAALNLIRELLDKGVAQRRSDGAIFSARMVRDEHLRKVRKKNGFGGKVSRNQSKPPEDEDEEIAAQGESGERGTDDLDEMVAEIYSVYPLKVGRPAALKAIRGAIQRGSEPSDIFHKTVNYAECIRKSGVTPPHPSTWFNQDRFNDTPETWTIYQKNGENALQLTKRKESVEKHMEDLKRRHYSETQSLIAGKYVPSGWRNSAAKQTYMTLKLQVSQLNERISKS